MIDICPGDDLQTDKTTCWTIRTKPEVELFKTNSARFGSSHVKFNVWPRPYSNNYKYNYNCQWRHCVDLYTTWGTSLIFCSVFTVSVSEQFDSVLHVKYKFQSDLLHNW